MFIFVSYNKNNDKKNNNNQSKACQTDVNFVSQKSNKFNKEKS